MSGSPNPNSPPLVSVVMGSFNRNGLIQTCIDGVREELESLCKEIIVVDGGSTDGTLEWLIQQKDIITICQHNRGEWNGSPIERRSWGYFMNLGFKCAQGKYVCMLSDDSLIVPGAIRNGLQFFEASRNAGEELGALAFYFRDYPVRKRYAVAVNVGNLYVNHGLYLREALEKAGYASEDEYHFYFADTDLTLKIKSAGYVCKACPESFVEHYFEATPEIRSTNNDEKKERDRRHLIEKWCGIAYPQEDRDRYDKIVGFWDFLDIDDIDGGRTINRLIASTKQT